MSLNFVSFDFQRNTNNTDINKVVVSKPKKKQVSKQPAKTKVKT
jgi:hypothetical protein